MVGKTLRQLRQDREVSIYQLAANSGVAHQIIYSIEKGETPNPTFETVRKLLRGMGATFAELETTETETTAKAA